MKKIFIVALTIVILCSLVIGGCAKPAPAPTPSPGPAPAPSPAPAPQKSYKWRLQAFYPPPEEKFTIGLVEFAKRINEATNGQVEIELFPGGTLVPPTEILKSVGEGIVEMGLNAPGYNVGFLPFCAVPDGLPLSWRKPDDILECMRGRGLADIMTEEYQKQGVHFLAWQVGGPITIISKKPLRNKADFQGTKMRGWGMWNKYFGMLGASAVDMPLMDTYTGLAMGTVDTAVTGLAAHYTLKHYESAKYGMTPYPLGDMVHELLLNEDLWNSLPDDLKNSVQTAANEFTDWSTGYFYETYDLAYHDKLSNEGVEWIEVEAETQDWMQQKAMELWDELSAKDPLAEEAMNIMVDYFKEAGYIK